MITTDVDGVGTVRETWEQLVKRGANYTIEDIHHHVNVCKWKLDCDVCGKELGFYRLINPEESSIDVTCLDCMKRYGNKK